MNFVKHLENDILRPWIEHGIDRKHGGFHGYMDEQWKPNPEAPKGLLQHARILWTFSAAYARTRNPVYKTIAEQTRAYLQDKFLDRVNEGWFWSIDPDGLPRDRRKHVFAHAYVIYAFAEYAMAFSDESALQVALRTFFMIDRRAWDKKNGGYVESFSEQWEEVDQPAEIGITGRKKTMNTHMHMLEALTALHRSCKKIHGMSEEVPQERLGALLDICRIRIYNPDRHSVDLFFEPDWRRLPSPTSYGHDIEMSWLLDDAAYELGRTADTRAITTTLARNTIHGVENGAGMYTEGDSAGTPAKFSRFCWALAEGLIGFLNAYLVTRDETLLRAYWNLEDWVFTHQVDRERGDWYEEIDKDNQPKGTKCHLWREPSHQARACLELERRWAQADITLANRMH